MGLFAGVRLEKLDGFINVLFSGEGEIALPEWADLAADHLSEPRQVVTGICELASPNSEGGDAEQIETCSGYLRELTRITETEINETVRSCVCRLPSDY